MAIDPSDEQKDTYQKRYSRLLAVLQEKHGQWMTRRKIANALGTTRFNNNDVLGMACLESVGLIETRRVAHRRYEYRIKP